MFKKMSRGGGLVNSRPRAARKSLVLALVTAYSLLVGLGLSVVPHPVAAAVGNYPNSAIADVALRYNDQWGGNACRDAGKLQSGQCKQFVNCVVFIASGGSQYPAPGYHSGFAAHGTEVSGGSAVRGDIIQVGNSDYDVPLHTAIVLENKGGGLFRVVDSNYVGSEKVGTHDWRPPAGSRFWRLGQADHNPIGGS